MKVLLVNCAYTIGSTGKIVSCISSTLRANEHMAYTCYGIGDHYYDDFSEKVCSDLEHKFNALKYRIDGLPYGGIHLSNNRIEKIIERTTPDVVNLHCVNASMVNIYQLLKYLAKRDIKTVVTLHAEFMHTGGCDHAFDCEQWKTKCIECPTYKQKLGTFFFDRASCGWQKMYDAFALFKNENLVITAVSPWLANRAKESSILKGRKIVYVPNGLDPLTFHYEDHPPILDRESYEKLLLFVTPNYSYDIHDLKGGRFIPELARKLPNYKLVVVCSRNASNLGDLPANVLIYGRAKSQQDLAKMYAEADVSLLLSSRETFSMVTAESLCCGTPVVGFRAGGPESIAIQKYSEFVEYGNLELLIEAISRMVVTPIDKAIVSKQGIEIYSTDVMTSGYLRVYHALRDDEI